MTRSVRSLLAVALLLTGAVAASPVVAAPAAAAPAVPACIAVAGDVDCDAYYGPDIMGTTTVGQRTATTNDVLRVTATSHLQPSWLRTETGYAPSGVGAVTVTGPGKIVDFGPKSRSDLDVSVAYNQVTWTGIETRTTTDGSGVPSSRFTPGTSFWITVRVSAGVDGPSGSAEALFRANRGYTQWSMYSRRIVTLKKGNPPVAHFDVKHSATDALKVSFDGSRSTAPAGAKISRYDWDFGDGHKARGLRVTHTFPRPGAFRVSLVVSDNKGQKSAPVAGEVNNPGLTVRVLADTPAAGVAVGATINVRVIVTGQRPVHDLTVDPPRVTGASSVLVGGPSGSTSGLSLGWKAARTFTYAVKSASAGHVTFRVSAHGTADTGPRVAGSATGVYNVGSDALAIEVATDPAEVRLAVTDAGKVVPKAIAVTVKVTNTANRRLTGVTLRRLDADPDDPSQLLDRLAFARGTLPLTIGDLAADQTWTKRLSLTVTGDGDYHFSAAVDYADATSSDGGGTVTDKGGDFRVTVPLLFFQAEREATNITSRNGQPWVRAGNNWFVGATIKNLSSYRTLCVPPVAPKLTWNAAGVGPHDITVVDARTDAPPFAGPLKPGEKVPLDMYVATEGNGPTRSRVQFDPGAGLMPLNVLDAACTVASADSFPTLSAKDVHIVAKSTDFLVHVDISSPVAPPLGAIGSAVYFFGGLAFGAVEGIAEKLQTTFSSLRFELPSAQEFAQRMIDRDPGVVSMRTAAAAYSNTLHAAELIGNYWRTASPEEKQAYDTQLASVLRRSGSDAWTSVNDAVLAQAHSWLDRVTAAYASGDDRKILFALSSSGGNALAQISTDIAITELGVRLVKGLPALGRTFEAAYGESTTITALKGMPAGKLLNFTEMQGLWGLAKADVQAFATIAKEEGVLIGVRGRAPISVANLEEGAVWKHENLKPKNVNDIDVRFLEFAKQDSGLVAFRTFDDAARVRILKRVENASLTAEQKAAVLDRYRTRIGEEAYITKIEGFAKKGEIDVGFNYRENGVDQGTTQQVRKFALDKQKVTGGTYFRPLQENIHLDPSAVAGASLPKWCKSVFAAALCRITGDMDGVYLTNVDGTSIDHSRLVRIYERLQKAGWQHPETLTWVKDSGQFFFGSKKKILAGLQVGAEPMIEFAPDGKQRATYLNLNATHLFAPDCYVVDIIGGYTATL